MEEKPLQKTRDIKVKDLEVGMLVWDSEEPPTKVETISKHYKVQYRAKLNEYYWTETDPSHGHVPVEVDYHSKCQIIINDCYPLKANDTVRIVVDY